MSSHNKPRAAGCSCVSDPFADLPPDLRPDTVDRAEKTRRFGLRTVTCPVCGAVYTTNRNTDVCIDCEKKGLKEPLRQEGAKGIVLTIKVLGPGCANCQRLEEIASQELENIKADHPDVEGEVQKVTDVSVFMQYGLLITPGLVINEKLVCAGQQPAARTIMGWLNDALGVAS
jgi:hypothetical protein